ncbi:biotin synthase BioB [Glycomyces buryatensis]|uniref:Biotin synthase n=1 Tax=Glycomyces buryatensis TaxID=2570927 RepID=A0A4V4HR98_9ACTN|nr:biotin synthase BioB [Glycomyces buryatensis]THV36966.1 biotin synthase BioB [Glycomyces buryatensis]
MPALNDVLNRLSDAADAGETPSAADLEAVLASSDAELMDVVAAAARLRFRHFGNKVKLNYLVNLKSGLCPEDCNYCSQRLGSKADVLKYTWLTPEAAAEQAAAGVSGGASRVCLVASGRGPTDMDVERVGKTIAAVKNAAPGVEVCACLGLLKDGQADRLADLGADAYNHNLNTSEDQYAEICSTHTFADRVDTVNSARAAGLSPCSGLIAGMGESHADLVAVALGLREIGSDSIPVNFLLSFDGTPLEGKWELDPRQCLRILAMVRLANPAAEVRLAAGREVHLRHMQGVALQIVNSIFLGDYLTSEGQAAKDDLELIADAGLVPLGLEEAPEAVREQVKVRRRGAGTEVAPNA